MSDLFKGLIKWKFWPKGGFWGKYVSLNYLDNYDLNNNYLATIQKARLRNLEQLSINKQYKFANEFIQKANLLLQSEEGLPDEIKENVYGRILQLMNAGLVSSKLNPNQINNNFNSSIGNNQQFSIIINEIIQLLNMVSPNKGTNQQIIESLNKALLNDIDIKKYKKIKSDYAEKLMVDILNKNEGWISIQTGNFVDRLGQQLIEDVMSYEKKNLSNSFTNGLLGFSWKDKTTGVRTNSSAISLADFFNQINKLNDNFTITLSDELYEALKIASVLNTQVKSGMKKESILTTAQRNAISLEECGFSHSKLWELYMLPNANIYFKLDRNQQSKQLDAIANLFLSKSIILTNLNRNQLYYTESGFTTASQWLKINERMIKFLNPINSLSPTMCKIKRPYGIQSINSKT